MALLLGICWLCLLVLLLTENAFCLVPCVDHSSVGLEVENTVCLVRGSRQTPGGDRGFLSVCLAQRPALGTHNWIIHRPCCQLSFTASADLEAFSSSRHRHVLFSVSFGLAA